MATRTLNVVIAGDSKGITKATRETERSIDRMSRSGSRSLSALRTGMLAVSAAAATGMVVGLKKSTEAAIESEKANARLQAQLKALDISYSAHEKQIQRVIDRHSQLSGFDDEDLGDSFTNIIRVVGDVNKALELNAVAMDIARARHMEVAQAGELVGKVAGGNIGILSRYGIVVKDGATAAEALAELQRKFSGQAEAYGRTTAGAQDRARVALENLGETIGARVTPLVARLAEGFNKFVRQMTLGEGPGGRVRKVLENIGEEAIRTGRRIGDLVDWFRRHRTATTVLLSVVSGLTAAFVAYKVATIAAAVATRTLAAASVLLNVALRANPIGLVVTAVIALGAALVTAYRRSDTFRKIVQAAFEGAKRYVRGAATVFEHVLLPGIRAVISGAEKLWGVLKKVGSVLGTIGNAASDAAGFLNPFGDGLGQAASSMDITGLGGKGGLMGADPDLGPFAAIGRGMGLSVTSGIRPGAVTSSGNRSWHASGDAIDMSGSPGAMMKFATLMRRTAGPKLRELIYTPMGIGIKDGKPYQYSGQVAADHFDHVHVAYTGPFGDGLGRFESTSYGPPWGGIQGTGVTATGVNLKSGPKRYGVAVDPSVIRLGSMLKITPNPFGYGGLFEAFDTGGAIKGRRIDFYDWRGRKAQLAWGRRTVSISTGSNTRRGGGGPSVDGGGRGGRGGPSVSGPSSRTETPTGPGAPLGFEGSLARVGVRRAKAEKRDDLSGLIKAMVDERAIKRRRLKRIRKVLRGRLTRARRIRLLQEEAQLVGEIGDLTESIKEYRADQRGGATTISRAEELEAGVDTSADTGGGGDAGGGGVSDNSAAIAELTAAIDRMTKFNEWMIRTQGPSIVNAVVAAVNGGIGGPVGLGFQGIRSAPGSVAGL